MFGRKGLKKDGYKIEDGAAVIEMSVTKPDQLFDERDPSPFIEKDLDDDAVDYIVSAVQEFSHSHPMKLHIYFTEKNQAKKKNKNLTDQDIALAIRNYFTYTSSISKKKLRKSLKNSQGFLIMGIMLLVACLSISEFLNPYPTLNILKSGFEIAAWVALWRPLELIFFEWWGLYEKRRTLDKISSMEIQITDVKTETTNIFKNN